MEQNWEELFKTKEYEIFQSKRNCPQNVVTLKDSFTINQPKGVNKHKLLGVIYFHKYTN